MQESLTLNTVEHPEGLARQYQPKYRSRMAFIYKGNVEKTTQDMVS